MFVGCRQPAKVLVYDTTSGKEIGGSDIVGDTDDLFYDMQRKRLYVRAVAGSSMCSMHRPRRWYYWLA